MNRILSVTTIISALGMAALFIGGCATNRVDLVDKGLVSVETVPSEKVKILWTDVYLDGEETIVYGVIQRRSHTSYPLRTHVDVTVYSSEGKTLHEARTQDIYVPGRIPGKGISWKRVKIRLPEIPPQNSMISMTVHSGEHEGLL